MATAGATEGTAEEVAVSSAAPRNLAVSIGGGGQVTLGRDRREDASGCGVWFGDGIYRGQTPADVLLASASYSRAPLRMDATPAPKSARTPTWQGWSRTRIYKRRRSLEAGSCPVLQFQAMLGLLNPRCRLHMPVKS